MKKQLIESAVIKMFAEIPQERGELDLDEIKKISEDIDINSALNKINRSVAGRDYFLRGINADVGEDKIEKVMEIFSKIKFNRIFNEALEARLYGYSTFEIIYDLDFSIKSLVPIPQKNISYDSTNKKWEIKIGSSKIDLDYQKFMHCIHRWTPAKVTGKSIMDVCNASFTDKTSLERQLRGLAKKYGDVITIFGYDPGEEEDKVKERADNLRYAR